MKFTEWYRRQFGYEFDEVELKTRHKTSFNEYMEFMQTSYITFCVARREPVQMNI